MNISILTIQNLEVGSWSVVLITRAPPFYGQIYKKNYILVIFILRPKAVFETLNFKAYTIIYIKIRTVRISTAYNVSELIK